MVGHAVGPASGQHCAAVHVSPGKRRLPVPAGELHQIEEPDRQLQGVVRLPVVRAQGADAGAEIRQIFRHKRRLPALGLIRGVALIAPDIHHVPLAISVAPVPVGGGELIALLLPVGDPDGEGIRGHLHPELGDGHQRILPVRDPHHPGPRILPVKRRGPRAGPHGGNRVRQPCGIVRPDQPGTLGVRPGHAVDVDRLIGDAPDRRSQVSTVLRPRQRPALLRHGGVGGGDVLPEPFQLALNTHPASSQISASAASMSPDKLTVPPVVCPAGMVTLVVVRPSMEPPTAPLLGMVPVIFSPPT